MKKIVMLLVLVMVFCFVSSPSFATKPEVTQAQFDGLVVLIQQVDFCMGEKIADYLYYDDHKLMNYQVVEMGFKECKEIDDKLHSYAKSIGADFNIIRKNKTKLWQRVVNEKRGTY